MHEPARLFPENARPHAAARFIIDLTPTAGRMLDYSGFRGDDVLELPGD
jgi:hypothetical protein